MIYRDLSSGSQNMACWKIYTSFVDDIPTWKPLSSSKISQLAIFDYGGWINIPTPLAE